MICAQKALVQESVVQGLSKPNKLPGTFTVTSEGKCITLKGMDTAHWAALKWVSRLIDADFAQLASLEGCDADTLDAIRTKCYPLYFL
jgi:hypothetical protein